jgi:adenylate kinase
MVPSVIADMRDVNVIPSHANVRSVQCTILQVPKKVLNALPRKLANVVVLVNAHAAHLRHVRRKAAAKDRVNGIEASILLEQNFVVPN